MLLRAAPGTLVANRRPIERENPLIPNSVAGCPVNDANTVRQTRPGTGIPYIILSGLGLCRGKVSYLASENMPGHVPGAEQAERWTEDTRM
jgi:hypothetical protein